MDFSSLLLRNLTFDVSFLNPLSMSHHPINILAGTRLPFVLGLKRSLPGTVLSVGAAMHRIVPGPVTTREFPARKVHHFLKREREAEDSEETCPICLDHTSVCPAYRRLYRTRYHREYVAWCATIACIQC